MDNGITFTLDIRNLIKEVEYKDMYSLEVQLLDLQIIQKLLIIYLYQIIYISVLVVQVLN